MNLKYKVPVIFFVFLVIITLYMIKSKHSLKSDIYANETTGKMWLIIWDWKLNFSSNYQPGLPFSHKTDQNWNLNFSKNYQPGLPSSQKSGQELEPYSVCNTNLPAVNKLQDVRKYGQVDSIPSKEELEGATADQLVSLYHSYLDNIDYLCQWKFRLGKIGDGGWEICDDVEYRPIQPCTIFSFGINYDFSFDDEASELYGCLVYSFDHSMANTEMHKHSKNVFFYKIGIRGENDVNRTDHSEIMTFSALRAMLHYSQIIDVVKMDVEGSEWETLTLMAKEGQLQSIRQLLIEYHFWDRITDCKALIYRLNVLRLIEDHGFRRFYVHKGPVCRSRIGNFPVEGTYCYGIHYVNSLLKRPK